MFGVKGKIKLNYSYKGVDYEETFAIDEEMEYTLSKCKDCRMVISEVYYVIDTIYGADVYFVGYEEESYLVVGNEYTEFRIDDIGIVGKMKIVMF